MLRASCLVILSCVLGACTFQDEREHCSESSPCGANQSCYKGFCLQSDETDSENELGEGGKSGSSGRGSTSNPNTAAGTSGGKGGKGGSGGKPPAANGGTQANGSCTPAPEECNGVDDDCDNNVDEQLDRVCYPAGQPGCTQASDETWSCEGLCALGKATCENGEYGECADYTAPASEACTPTGMLARDEDCNGMIDETCSCTAGETRSCYNGRAGTLDVGKCVAGTQACANGTLGPCTGAVIPSNETCANPGIDDDCDGMLDNILNLGAACVVPGAKGPCAAGTFQCTPGKAELSCVSATMPGAETCNGVDDDCNGQVDNGASLCPANNRCDAGQCVPVPTAGTPAAGMPAAGVPAAGMPAAGVPAAGMPAAGMPAAGMPAAGMPAAGMPAAGMPAAGMPAAGMPAAGAPPSGGAGAGGMSEGGAGAGGMPMSMMMSMSCSPACSGGTTCCNGMCIDTSGDAMNCGGCGIKCTAGMQPGCCGGKCVDLVSNTNCGTCGKDCSLLSTSSITCTCMRNAQGTVACTGPLLNLCL